MYRAIVRVSVGMAEWVFSGPEVLFKTCVALKFVDDDDDGKSVSPC